MDGISITELEQKAEIADNDNFVVDSGIATNRATAKQIKDYMGLTYIKKAGDSMLGQLIMEMLSEGIKFKGPVDEDGNYNEYTIRFSPGGSLIIYNKDTQGLAISADNGKPVYYTGEKSLRLLTMFDYTAATNLTSFTADRDYLGYIRNNEHQYTVTIDGQEVARFMPSLGYIPNVSTPILIPAGSVVSITGSASIMVKFPLIGG